MLVAGMRAWRGNADGQWARWAILEDMLEGMLEDMLEDMLEGAAPGPNACEMPCTRRMTS